MTHGPTAPWLTLLIPSRDRHASLRRTLPGIRRAAAAVGAAIIICDQSPTAFVQPGPWRILHRPDLPGLPAARNLLLNTCRSEWACFCDDDVDMAADFCVVLARQIARDPAVVAWGPVVECRSRRQRRRHRLLQLGAHRDCRRLLACRRDGDTPLLFGCCFAVHRQTAEAISFDRRLTGYALGEDADFFSRLPGRKRFCRALRLIHRCDRDGRHDRLTRGHAKARFALSQARKGGRRNPVAPLHLVLALLAAAGPGGREASSWRGVAQALLGARSIVKDGSPLSGQPFHGG